MPLTVQELNSKNKAMYEELEYWKQDYVGLAKVFKARKVRFLEEDYSPTDGNLRTDILDGTGVRSARTLAAGLHGGLTSQARPWFELGFEDVALNESQSVNMWLDEVQRRMRAILARSNFYMAIHSLYLELGVFGTGFMFAHADTENDVRFDTLTVGRYALSIDARGVVNAVTRDLDMPARNIKAMFGYDKCSQDVQTATEDAATELKKFPVRHMIIPNEDREPGRLDSANKRWSSYYYEPGQSPRDSSDKLLRVSGYDSFPGFGPRWSVDDIDGIYGYSPAMDSLGDGRMLQSVRDTFLRVEHKRADPPMVVPEGIEDKYDSLPGGITPLNSSLNGQQQIYQAEDSRQDTSGILVITQDVRTAIREGMYNDLFKMFADMPPTARITATEVAERHGEKLMQLGPVLERLHAELFNPLIDRVFQIMVDTDQIPEPPEEIQGVPIKVEFISILAQAQKILDTTKVDQFMGFIAAYADLLPGLADVPNADAVGDGYAEYLSIPTIMTNSTQDRKAKRAAAAVQNQTQDQVDLAGAASGIAKTMSDTPLGDTTALDAVMDGIGG